jgi:transposase
MDLGRFLVDAVVLGGASPTQLARSHPISESWLFRLLARYRAGGYPALEPRSRRPKSSPRQTSPEIQQAIVELRRELVEGGLDAGAQTIAHHLRLRFGTTPSRPTIWRILKANGLITPQPHKRPKSSWIRPAGGDDPLVLFTLSAARLISLRGIFVMAPRGAGKEPTLVRSDQWLEAKLPAVAATDARAELVRRFLSSFAPATSQDLAWWANTQTSPAPRRAADAHAARIWSLVDEEITQVERPDGSVAFVLTDDVDRLADPPKVIGVRLVPPHDPLLMARDRDNIVSRQHHSRLWRSAHNPGVILGATGLIATWTARKQARHLNITIEPLGSAIDRKTRDAIADEAALTAELRGCDDARLEVAS